MFGSLGIPVWHVFATAFNILSVECSTVGTVLSRINWGTIIKVGDWADMSVLMAFSLSSLAFFDAF
jgi:hypothetical protein